MTLICLYVVCDSVLRVGDLGTEAYCENLIVERWLVLIYLIDSVCTCCHGEGFFSLRFKSMSVFCVKTKWVKLDWGKTAVWGFEQESGTIIRLLLSRLKLCSLWLLVESLVSRVLFRWRWSFWGFSLYTALSAWCTILNLKEYSGCFQPNLFYTIDHNTCHVLRKRNLFHSRYYYNWSQWAEPHYKCVWSLFFY